MGNRARFPRFFFGAVGLALLLLLLPACRWNPVSSVVQQDEPLFSGNRLVVATHPNMIDYFQQQGNPMGYQYELLEAFAEEVGYQLEWVVNSSVSDDVDQLLSGDVDIIAPGLMSPALFSNRLVYTEALSKNRQVLLQRKGETDTKYFCQGHYDGKLAAVQTGTSIEGFLRSFAPTLTVVASDTLTLLNGVEALERGDIDFLVCDAFRAKSLLPGRPALELNPWVSYSRDFQAWVLRRSDQFLLQQLNDWLSNFRQSARFALIYERYHNERALSIRLREFHSASAGSAVYKISPYDDLLRKYSGEHGFDWRFTAAIMYHESRFQPGLFSAQGAFGLMQVLPSTARRFGITETTHSAQILSGLKVMAYLDNLLQRSVPDTLERMKFIAAAYNGGYAHVQDAMRVAEKFRLNKGVWDGTVELCLASLRPDVHYSSEVVKFGPFRSGETRAFVRNVFLLYTHYRNTVPR
ncbi:MAG: transporter substrate-binding domain-containing protein [Bacteroidales bacterium]